MSIVLKADPQKILYFAQELYGTSYNILNLTNHIVESVNNIQSGVRESFPVPEADILEQMTAIAEKVIEDRSACQRMDRIIQEFCEDLKMECHAYTSAVYAAPDTMGGGSLLNEIF